MRPSQRVQRNESMWKVRRRSSAQGKRVGDRGAVRLTVGFALGPAGLHRVQAAVMPHNAASLRVLDKAGFRREGLAERYLCTAGKWEDHVILAITSDERREPR